MHPTGPGSSPPDDESEARGEIGQELIIGIVTPVGTDTDALIAALSTALDDYHYKAIELHLSDEFAGQPAPLGEREDQRIRRLIRAGDEFCARNPTVEHPLGDPAAIARRAIRAIRVARLELYRQDESREDAVALVRRGRPRTAYILRTLKRPAEVQLLRHVFKGQFVLIGSQTTTDERRARLLGHQMSTNDPVAKSALVDELMALDGKETDDLGQRVNETYPLSDFFVGLEEEQPARAIKLLFGEPIAPTVGEFAMYVARACRRRLENDPVATGRIPVTVATSGWRGAY